MGNATNLLGLSLRDEQNADWLGLRLTDEVPSLSKQYGIDLLDERPLWRFEDRGTDNEADMSHFGDGYRAPEPTPEPSLVNWSCNGGSAFGWGPSVTVTPGPTEYSFSFPVYRIVSAVLSLKDGRLGIGAEVGLTDRFKVQGVELAALSAGFELVPYALGRSSISANARVLGIGCKLSIEAEQVAKVLDQISIDAAKAAAPYAEHAERLIYELYFPHGRGDR
jgi:hypothetical protein